MTRYYVRYNHTRESVNWETTPASKRFEASNNLLMIVDTESENMARKIVADSVEFTDSNKIVSVSAEAPKGMEYLGNKEIGFFAPLSEAEKKNIVRFI